MTARRARTIDVLPEQVYVKPGVLAASTQGTEHLSITIWMPPSVSESKSDVGEAVVVSTIAAKLSLPELTKSTLRWTASPGASPDALMESLFVDEPVPPRTRTGTDEPVGVTHPGLA